MRGIIVRTVASEEYGSVVKGFFKDYSKKLDRRFLENVPYVAPAFATLFGVYWWANKNHEEIKRSHWD